MRTMMQKEPEARLTKYRPDIDGLRAVAVLPVLLFHAGLGVFGGGFVGVDIFFVISGYVITRRLLDDATAGRFSIADFYARRIRRIFPALFVMILLTWIAGFILFLPPQFEDLSKSAAASALFSSNIYFWLKLGYFDVSALMRPLLHTWSLSVEEQYYVFMPIAIYMVARFGGRRWGLFFIPATLASFAISIYGSKVAHVSNFLLLPSRACELLLGALLILTPLPAVRQKPIAEILGLAGLGMIAYAIFAFTEETAFPGVNALYPCVGAALLIYVGESNHRTFVTRALYFAPLVWIGLISYSLYLVHWPLIVFTRFILLREPDSLEIVLLIAASFALAYLSYRFVEQPFRHPSAGQRSLHVLAAGSAVMATIAAIGITGILTKGMPQRFPDFVQRDINAESQWMARKCFLFANQTWRDWDATACTRTTGHATTALLWGDSFAAQYSPGLVARAAALNRNIIQYTAAGCKPIFAIDSYSVPNCGEFNRHVVDVIRERGVTEVIVAGRWSSLHKADWQSLRDTVAALAKMNLQIYVVGQSPEFPLEVQTLAFRQRRNQPDQMKSEIIFEPTVNDDMARLFSGLATFIDPLKALCDDKMCPYMQNNEFIYMDYGHFSTFGSGLAVDRYFLAQKRDIASQRSELIGAQQ